MAKKMEKSMPFAEALMQLDGVEPPSDIALQALSGASKEQLPELEKVWRMLAPERRAMIIDRLREIAVDDVEAEFSIAFRVGLRDTDASVRAASALGLWEDESPDVITPLVQALRHDSADAVRAAAAYSLGHYLYASEIGRLAAGRGREIYDALLYAVRHSPDESPVYQRALESLGYAGTPDVEFFVRSAHASDDPALRLSAVIAMGRSSNQSYQPLVRGELQHVSPAIRREAARAAGELEDVDAVKDLGELIDDSEAPVREAALEALAKAGGLEAKRLIDAVIASADEDLKTKAEEASQLYDMLHGEFDFNIGLFDEESRTSFHSIKPEIEAPKIAGVAPAAPKRRRKPAA